MSATKVLVTEQYLDDIADAIRGKNGGSATYKPSQMAAAVTALPDPAVLDDKTITANGTYDAGDDSLDGYSEVTVNVPNTYAAGDEGKVVSNGALVAQTARSSDITENGTYDTTLNDEVTVDVAGSGGGGVPENDLLFHFDTSYENTGKIDAVLSDVSELAISNEQSKFGGHSLKCGLASPHADNLVMPTGFTLGSHDFTLDFWVYPTSLDSSSYAVPFSTEYRSFGIYLKSNLINFAVAKTSSSWFADLYTTVSLSTNQWYHIAVVRDGSYIYFFLNGTKVNDLTVNIGQDAIATNGDITIGANSYNGGTSRFYGYIDELRLKIGEAVWTSDFTPPTEPYADTSGQGGGGVTPESVLSGTMTSNENGITFSERSITDDVGTIKGTEFSAGFEGFNVAFSNLTAGKQYLCLFKWKTVSGAYFTGEWMYGFKVSNSQVSSYDVRYQDSGWTEMTRDFNEHTYAVLFTPSGTTAYLVFCLPGYSDSVSNTFELTNLMVLDPEKIGVGG